MRPWQQVLLVARTRRSSPPGAARDRSPSPAVNITIRYPAVFDPHVLTFDIAHFRKTAAKCGIEMRGVGLRQAADISDHRHRWLLRARRKRPRRRRAAKQCDELAPSSLDHLVRASEQAIRRIDADCLRGFHIDNKLKFCRILDRQVPWLFAFQYAVHVDRGLPV